MRFILGSISLANPRFSTQNGCANKKLSDKIQVRVCFSHTVFVVIFSLLREKCDMSKC